MFLKSVYVYKYIPRSPIVLFRNKHICSMESNIIKEGKALITFPQTEGVFYNPVQEFNRDISILAIKEFMKLHKTPNDANPNSAGRKFKKFPKTDDVTILEALSASGLRSIRYALEIPNVTNIVANDLSKDAVESIKININNNNVKDIVTPSLSDASLLMYQHRDFNKRFTIIDLDPYGSPAPFLDSAVQSIADGGILLVTCTDMAILCGNNAETCRAKYGSVSIKINSCHELALRIVLQSIESHANRYGRYIVPLLSLSADFYIRLFVRIYTSPKKVKQSTSKLAMIYNCTGCHLFHFQCLGRCLSTEKGVKYASAHGPPVSPHCSNCGSPYHLGGPIWIDPIHCKSFVENMLESLAKEQDNYKTNKRIYGILSVIFEELDNPLYYAIDSMASVIHATTPKLIQLRSAFLNAGYKISQTHIGPGKIKTDAPGHVVWDIFKEWLKLNPSKRTLLDQEPAKLILAKESSIPVSFELHPHANPESREQGLLRYQVNPEPNWGPKCRAKPRKEPDTPNDDAQPIKRVKKEEDNTLEL